jgi:TetR/AcrR family transcriptional repressor of mexJK operon
VQNQSARKRAAILEAAMACFLKNGYLGTNMDQIAARSAVSKQTVYKHFENKELLFVEIVSGMTRAAGDGVLNNMPNIDEVDDVERYLFDYAMRQLTAVMTPPLMQLRRLVIGEVPRFPELARALYENGPKRAMTALAAAFETFRARGDLTPEDPHLAASHFNWLIMSAPLNQAMLLGDEAIPGPDELGRHAREGVRVFLAAYGAKNNRPAGDDSRR